MTGFFFALGYLIYDIFTIWLAMLGVLFIFDVAVSKLRRRRLKLQSWLDHVSAASIFTAFALAAGTVDHYILSPALGAGIQFFWS